MITNTDLRDQKLFLEGEDIDLFNFAEAWNSGPPIVEDFIDSYKCGATARARYLLRTLMRRMSAFDRELRILEEIEQLHGRGCFMDLNSFMISTDLKRGFLKEEMQNAISYQELCVANKRLNSMNRTLVLNNRPALQSSDLN